eukprot:771614_1
MMKIKSLGCFILICLFCIVIVVSIIHNIDVTTLNEKHDRFTNMQWSKSSQKITNKPTTTTALTTTNSISSMVTKPSLQESVTNSTYEYSLETLFIAIQNIELSIYFDYNDANVSNSNYSTGLSPHYYDA